MAEKKLNIILRLQDKFTPALKGTAREIREQKRQMNAATREIKKFGTAANNAFLGAAKMAGKAALAVTAVGSVLSVANLKAFADQSVELAKAQIDAETKLEAVLGNVPAIAAGGAKAIEDAKQQLFGYASELQGLGVIGDEVTLSGMQQLATFQLTTDSIKKLSGGMTDLLAQQHGLNSTQEDAVAVANMIGKAMTGQTSALTRVGIVMSEEQKNLIKFGDEEKRAAVLAEVLSQNVGGVNAALAETDQGKIQQVANAYGDMQEEVGKKILAMKAVFAGAFLEYIPALQEKLVSGVEWVNSKLSAAFSWFEANKEVIIAGATKIWNTVQTVFKGIADHANILIPILAGVVAGFVAFNVATTIAQVLTVLTAVINGVSVAGGILNAVMMANPFVLLAMAIAALIAAGIALYKNWDVVKEKLKAAFDAVKDFFGRMKDSIVNGCTAVKDKFIGAFTSVRDKIGAIIDKIKEKIQPIIDLIYKVSSAVTGLDSTEVKAPNIQAPANPSVHGGRAFALGTNYAPGGLATINEGRRGEIVNLPNGSQVIPHDVAVRQNKGTVINVSVNVQGNVIGNQEFMEQVGSYVSGKVVSAMGVV